MNYDVKLNTPFTAKLPANKLSGELTGSLSRSRKFLARVINTKEGDDGLSHSRFVQAIATNLGATLPFTRSLADMSEKIFLEFFEGIIFCYMPVLMGSKLAKSKIFSKAASTPAAKAALVLGCAAVPAAGYALSFAKNLFTLKVFKKCDFSNVVNLDKNKKETPELQKKVEKSAKSHIRNSAIAAAAGLAASLALAGRSGKTVQKASEVFLNPGRKLYEHLEKRGTKVSNGLKSFLDSYGSLDFARKSDGTPGLGKGQLGLTVTAAVCGYFGAAKDRGRLDVMEVATRLPVIALYTIFGSELLDSGFKKYLFKNKKYTEILTKDEKGALKTASLNDIPEIAKKSGKSINELFKGKAVIAMVPFLFSLLAVGAFISGMSRVWTQYRYKRGVGNDNFTKAQVQPQARNPLQSRVPTPVKTLYEFIQE
ncbi:MAG: hypothetical protein LBK53_07595 [Heliobacteriaceae bacterium]|nr:hypothetical protein [Heliobacteriaceae bacterium]